MEIELEWSFGMECTVLVQYSETSVTTTPFALGCGTQGGVVLIEGPYTVCMLNFLMTPGVTTAEEDTQDIPLDHTNGYQTVSTNNTALSSA